MTLGFLLDPVALVEEEGGEASAGVYAAPSKLRLGNLGVEVAFVFDQLFVAGCRYVFYACKSSLLIKLTVNRTLKYDYSEICGIIF